MAHSSSEDEQQHNLPHLPPDVDRYALTFAELSQFFHAPLNVVCKHLDIGGTVFKKLCRRSGIPRWPHRKLMNIEKCIANCKKQLESDPDNDSVRLSLAELIEERHKIKTEPTGCESKPTKPPSSFTFMQWNPDCPNQDQELPAFTRTKSESSQRPPPIPPSLEPMEPNLQLKLTQFGFVPSWNIPALHTNPQQSCCYNSSVNYLGFRL